MHSGHAMVPARILGSFGRGLHTQRHTDGGSQIDAAGHCK